MCKQLSNPCLQRAGEGSGGSLLGGFLLYPVPERGQRSPVTRGCIICCWCLFGESFGQWLDVGAVPAVLLRAPGTPSALALGDGAGFAAWLLGMSQDAAGWHSPDA